MSKPSIAIVGTGALGSSLALGLAHNGFTIAELISRDSRNSHARALARRVKAQVSTLARAALVADVIWLCVPDDAIARVASSLRARAWKRKVVLHSSGALPSDVLGSLRRGAAIGSAHPMMSFVRDTTTGFRDVWFALEGDRQAVSTARRIAADLGARSFQISADSKPLYHAFGAFLSPFLVTLLSAAEQVGTKAGLPRPQLGKIMRPIVMRTLENYFKRGAAASFSGPLVRGDVETISKHVSVLTNLPESELYAALVREAARILPVKRAKEILNTLEES